MAYFSVDFENYYHAIPGWESKPGWEWVTAEEKLWDTTDYLLSLLNKYKIKAIFYVVGAIKKYQPQLVKKIEKEGHIIGDHSFWHHHNEGPYDNKLPYRSPYWDKTPLPGLSGGFFMRFLPYWIFKKEVENSGILFIHPHDIMVDHPKLDSLRLTIKRRWGLKNARKKLERILREIEFDDPRKILEKSKKDIHLLAMERRSCWRRIWCAWSWWKGFWLWLCP